MYAEAKLAVFEASKPDIEALPPDQRRKFAGLCRHWADIAEPPSPTVKSTPIRQIPMGGVLLELSRGLRSD
jgi:hypothetical protein